MSQDLKTKEIEKLYKLFHQISHQGQQTSGLLERGQDPMPLTQHFQRLSNFESEPFEIIVLGLTIEARNAALGWFCGGESHQFSIHIPKNVGLVEIHLQKRGYVLEKDDGTPIEFDKLEPFLELVKNADVVCKVDGENWIDTLRLRMAAPAGLQDVLVSMPENVAAVIASPVHLKRLVSNANLLMIVAPSNHQISPEERVAVSEILSSVDVVWPVIVSDSSSDLSNKDWSELFLTPA